MVLHFLGSYLTHFLYHVTSLTWRSPDLVRKNTNIYSTNIEPLLLEFQGNGVFLNYSGFEIWKERKKYLWRF